MISRIGSYLLLACVALAATVAPAFAQRTAPAFGTADGPRQTFNVTFGVSSLTGIDNRDDDDVVVANFDLFEFDPDELTGGTWILGAEWLVPLGNFVEAGAGVAFTGQRESPSVYRDFVEQGTLAEIEQDLSLRVTPLSFTVRVLPLGGTATVQPYIGGGLGLFRYRYEEDGEFLDFGFEPPAIFVDTFEATGWEPGLVLLGGLRWASDSVSVGGEFRYHNVKADLDTELFLAPQLDMGGWVFQLTLGGRF